MNKSVDELKVSLARHDVEWGVPVTVSAVDYLLTESVGIKMIRSEDENFLNFLVIAGINL